MPSQNDVIFRDIFRRFYPKLLVYARSIVGSDDAEDVVSDVFVELWSRRDSLVLGDNVQGLLMRSVHNKSLNTLKHKKVENERVMLLDDISRLTDGQLDIEDSGTDQDMESAELRTRLISAINTLPEGSREVFKMSYIYNMKNAEIAQIKGISLRTVESHIYKSLKILRAELKKPLNTAFLQHFK